MKKLFALLVLVFSFNSFAGKISFSYSGDSNGNRYYYDCFYVEYQVEQYLELLGATNVYANCTGGITNTHLGPVSVRASFNSPVTTGNREEVEIKGDSFNPSCGLNVQIMKTILKAFPEVQVIQKSDACAFSSSNYFYKLSVPR